jgi:hypothetical protein
MRANEFLIESRGLFGRSTSDVVIDDNGNQMTFQSIDIFPSDKPGDAFKDEKTMLKAYNKVTKNVDPLEVNNRNPRALAFAVATFVHSDGSKDFWVKWFIKVPSDLLKSAWKNDEVPLTGPRWAFNFKTAKKARSGLTPQDLIKTDKQAFDTVPSIVDRIAPGLSEEIRQGVGMVAKGKLPAVFVGQSENMEAIRDHLGEIIQPIGLMSGVIKGDAEKAANEVLGAPYAKCKVIWPQSKNTGLIDSYFVGPSGKTLGVSSKGDKGANASVQNIQKAIEEAREKNPKLIEKNRKAITIIDTIAKADQKQGPLALGLKLGIISEEDMNEMLTYINVPGKKPRGLSPNLKYFMTRIQPDMSKKGYSVGYHMLAGLAKEVCDAVNLNPSFSKACLDFLNQSAIIQVYTEAKSSGNDVQITGFRSVYPPNFTGSVILTSSKTYYATGIKGRLTFDYKKS